MSEQHGKPIDVSRIDLEKMKEKTAALPALLPYAHTAGSAIIRPEDAGKITGRAVAAMHQQTEMQMSQLYKQMELLAAQATAIKQRVEISERIYLAKMPCEPLIGHTYYLYKKDDDTDTLSLIAPDDWGRTKPFKEFIAAVHLLADHTWEMIS